MSSIEKERGSFTNQFNFSMCEPSFYTFLFNAAQGFMQILNRSQSSFGYIID